MASPDALGPDLLDGLAALPLEDGLAALPLEEVRERRAACQRLENQLSYVRRLAQGRLDIVVAEVTARRDGKHDDRTLVQQLTEALSDRVSAPGSSHLPVALDPGEVDPQLLADLDQAGPPFLVSAPGSMSDDELAQVADSLGRFEQDVSARRRTMFDRIDALQGEVMRRYGSGEADVDSVLNG